MVLFAAAGTGAFATSFVVPSDRELIRSADAIVVASALSSYTQRTSENGIETVTVMSIEESIKGDAAGSINVVEPGGTFGQRATVIAGVPRFEEGQRMLLFLVRTGPSRWAVTQLVLGKFTFGTDIAGRRVLVRDEGEIAGWDGDLQPYKERRRIAEHFVEFIRSEAVGRMVPANYFTETEPLRLEPTNTTRRLTPVPQVAPFTANSYTMLISGNLGSRWAVFPAAVSWYSGTTQEAGAPGGGVTAIQAAFTSWDNDCGSNVNYVYVGTDDGSHAQGLHGVDGRNTVLFERDLSAWGVPPFTCSGNSYSGTLGIGGVTSASGQNSVNGEAFATTAEGDVEMNRGLANCTLLFNNGDFNSAVTHEVGHTLGFRHSDQNRASNAACTTDASLECSNQAIMKSFISTGLNATLQVWDQHAVQAVYPGNVCAPTTCAPPSITQQPAPANSTITIGASRILTVGASGTAPLSYQWYVGPSGTTTTPISGATGPSVSVSPSTTTQYWVRVSNSCGSVNSNVATVAVAGGGSPASFYLVTECRLLDTRGATGPYGGPSLAANSTRNVVVSGHCGVAAGASSVVIVAIALSPGTNGWMTLFPGPAGTAAPNAATLNYSTGKTRSNIAIIPMASDGSINVANFNSAGSSIPFVIDVYGYFK
ncbi:MAG TPA: hypothetical protein VGQ65_15650 [Thermoanaerobaculia bacterium]|jgi:hypothetical protein|nr:hypothetical protein [Thermoanaerobaculia bacterium]